MNSKVASVASSGSYFRRPHVSRIVLSLTLAAVLLADRNLCADDLPTARPEDVGLSTERLALCAVLMLQQRDQQVQRDFENAVMQTIVD